MGWKTDHYDVMIFSKFAELVCQVGVMSIENQEAIAICCISFSRCWFKISLEPQPAKFLVSPSLLRDRNTSIGGSDLFKNDAHGKSQLPSMARVVSPPFCILFHTLEYDRWWEHTAICGNGFNNSDKFTVSILDRI